MTGKVERLLEKVGSFYYHLLEPSFEVWVQYDKTGKIVGAIEPQSGQPFTPNAVLIRGIPRKLNTPFLEVARLNLVGSGSFEPSEDLFVKDRDEAGGLMSKFRAKMFFSPKMPDRSLSLTQKTALCRDNGFLFYPPLLIESSEQLALARELEPSSPYALSKDGSAETILLLSKET